MATPKWFDANAYMQNKLAQLKAQEPDAGWTLDKLYDAFREGGFVGAEGQYEHFVKFGAAEEVAPNAYFNADEYYAAKAKQYYEEELKQEFTGSEEQIASVKALIKDADMNAWTHYQQFGSAEGVNPSNAFDASDYCAAKAAAMIKAGQKAPDGTDWTAEKIAKAIDDAGMSVLEHYLTYAGTGEGEVAAGSTYPVSEDEQVVVPNPGKTVVVDGSATTYTGTAGDDKFYLKHASELHEYNTLDGGEGNDTLILDGQGLGGATIRNIENLVVNGGDGTDYDMSLFATSFTLKGGSAELTNVTDQKLVLSGATPHIAFSVSTLTVNMAAGQASVDLASQNRVTDQTVTLMGDSLTSVKLAVDEGTKAVNFTGSDAKVTDLAITATVSAAKDDAAKVDVAGLEELTNITVAGAGAVELTVDAAKDALKTVNAAENTGGVAVDLSAATKAAFAGGAGADTLTIAASTVAHDLGAGDDTLKYTDTLGVGGSVAGGEGTDTIVVANGKLGDLKTDFGKGNITGFEALTVTDKLIADIDMTDYAGINHLTVAGTSATEVKNMQSGSTLELTASADNAFEVSVKGAGEGKADVLNIALTANTQVEGKVITVAGVETINVVATDTDLSDGVIEHALGLKAAAATTVTVSGDAKLDLTLDAASSTAIKDINASENTGGLNVNLNTAKLSGITVTGSSAADEITLGFNNTVNGMGGDDTFTVSASTDGKANTSYSTIQGFAAGDKLGIAGVTAVVNAGIIQRDTLDAAVASAMAKTDSVTTAVSFTWGNDTYVVMDAMNPTNNTFDMGDFLVKLAGVTGVEFEADGANNLSLA